jgi:predicted amidohydrolase YtcJ
MLRAGYRADLVVFDRDLTRIPPGSLDQAKVKVTVSGGRVAFEQ